MSHFGIWRQFSQLSLEWRKSSVFQKTCLAGMSKPNLTVTRLQHQNLNISCKNLPMDTQIETWRN